MRTYLLPKEGQFYKANLHCHTTVSDGSHTPREMKEYYKEHGYRILAMTDHELLVDHSDLNDEEFLTITGYEYAFVEGNDYSCARTIELNLFAKDPHNETQVCFNPENVYHGETWRAKSAKTTGEVFERTYDIRSIQHVIDEARKNGFLVSLNHPHYSFESPAFFGQLNGLFAMEIHNQGSFYNANDYNPQMYDQMLRMGHKISCIAADDNHMAYIYDDEKDPRPWGFSMIKAPSLTYGDVMVALENGDFYASQGPEIFDLYIEDGVVHLECSPAKVVVMRTKYRHSCQRIAPANESFTHMEFQLPKDEYMRFEIIDAYGRHANTRAYFL